MPDDSTRVMTRVTQKPSSLSVTSLVTEARLGFGGGRRWCDSQGDRELHVKSFCSGECMVNG
jgi:hypothetical protein